MNVELLLYGTLVTSVLTGLTTEAIKKLTVKENRADNVIALTCSLVLSIAVSVSYVTLYNLAFTAEVIITIIAMVFLSALSSMLGYDKIRQTIEQLVTK